MAKTYDLIVIGAGMAGVAAADKCASPGWHVAIADAQPYGGTCALRGCDPNREAWAWRRSCMRTGKSTPLAFMAGSHTRVRKVFREIGVPAAVANSGCSRPMPWVLMWRATASSQASSTPNVLGSLFLG